MGAKRQDVANVEVVAPVHRHSAASRLVVDDDFRGEVLIGHADLKFEAIINNNFCGHSTKELIIYNCHKSRVSRLCV